MSIKHRNPTQPSQTTARKTTHLNRDNNKQRTYTEEESESILTKACCPNCKYIFQVVNQIKLNTLRDKLEKLTPIKEEKQKISTNNYEQPQYPQNLKNNQTPQFSPKSPKLMSARKNPVNNTGTPQKKGVNTQRQAMHEDDKQIKQDIQLMRKYLNEVNKQQKGVVKSHDISIDDQFLPKFNVSYEQGHPNKSNVEAFSSIHLAKIQLSRKCQYCHSSAIEVQTALSAAKSILLEKELNAMSHFVQREPSTPSYIKCLQQIAENS